MAREISPGRVRFVVRVSVLQPLLVCVCVCVHIAMGSVCVLTQSNSIITCARCQTNTTDLIYLSARKIAPLSALSSYLLCRLRSCSRKRIECIRLNQCFAAQLLSVGRSFGVAARNTYLVQGCDVCNAKFRVYFVLCRREIKPISVPTLFALRAKKRHEALAKTLATEKMRFGR